MTITIAVLKNTVEATGLFVKQNLGVHPAAVFADYHDASLMITLKDILTCAEKEHIKDKHIAELVTKTYIESYNSVKHTLETTIAAILGKTVTHSSLLIDAGANVGTILCTVSI